MEYYHILTNHAVGKNNRISFVCDLSYDALVNDYLLDYLSGEIIIVNGYQLNSNNTNMFKICVTNRKISDEISALRNSYYSSGIAAVGISEETILSSNKYSKDVTFELFKKGKDIISGNNTTEAKTNSAHSFKSKNVFVVHGHDTNRLEAIENFVRTIGYNPIVLFKEADNGKTIIEKIESYSDNVCYCLVLYTKCDTGYPFGEEDKKKPRARQNVVFEHGYMIGHLGRSKVTAILESNDIEIPGDINGVIYVDMDKAGMWKYRVANNMNAVGLNIDLNRIK